MNLNERVETFCGVDVKRLFLHERRVTLFETTQLLNQKTLQTIRSTRMQQRRQTLAGADGQRRKTSGVRKLASPIEFYRILTGFTGFHSVLLGFTGFYLVLLDYSVVTKFYVAVLCFTGGMLKT